MANSHINRGWAYKWSEYEDSVVKNFYPKNGANKVHEIIPNRSLSAIRGRAFKLGVEYLKYNKNYFDIIETPTKAYWLGFLYADGYITTDNRWGLELAYEDINHVQKLLDEIEYTNSISVRKRSRGNKICGFQIKNKHMHDSLKKNGVIMNKTENLVFPNKSILQSKYYSHFIRGFFDGDGCIYYNYITKPRKDRGNKVYTRLSKEVSIICKSDVFTKQLLGVLVQNNINLNWNINKQHNNLNVLKTGKIQEIIKFYKYIYSDSSPFNRLGRKYEKFNNLFIATNNSDVIKQIS